MKECFNLYHFPALLGVKVRADSEETNLVNCEAYSDAGFGSEYSHFALPFVDGVHDLIASELVAALQDQPLGKHSVNRYQLNSARSEEVKTASKPVAPKVVEKKTDDPKVVEEKAAPRKKMRFSRGSGKTGWPKLY